ncbi:MAG: hypothetical protein NT062_22280 [Proteobacteria bacterium]|nr:hypothetical protein [Pseudomonadota bacterium]
MVLIDVEIPEPRLASLQAAEPPYVTSLASIREDGGLTDWIYTDTQLHYRSMFEKSMYDDKLEIVEELCATILAHDGRGRAVMVGFDDGPDEGELFELAASGITHTAFDSPAIAEEIRAGVGYVALRARVTAAFADA